MRWNGSFCCEFDGKPMETEITWSELPNGRKTIVEQTPASEEIRKSKREGLWESVWDPSSKVNHMSKVTWDRKIITEFTRCISSTRIGKPVLMMDVKVSKDKILADGLIEWTTEPHLCWMKQNQKPCTKTKKVIDKGKKGKTLSEVKPIENMSKNLQSFLVISLMQKEVLPPHKLRDHAYEY